MKKILILFCFLSLNIFAQNAVVIDNCEYSTDVDAQAAYVGVANFDTYTKLLSHFDGTDGSTADYTAETGQTISLEGTAALKNLGANNKFSTSILLDGNSDYATVPDNDDWDFGDVNFTIDLWVRYVDTTGSHTFVSQYFNSGEYFYFTESTTGHRLRLYSKTYGSFSSYYQATNKWSPVPNTWYHIAVVRSASTCYMFINGSSLAITETTAFNTLANVRSILWIGSAAGTSNYFNGELDELRITKGLARWTSNFTPPTSAYSKQIFVQSYSESTIKTQASYSLKGIADITTSLNQVLTRTIASPVDLSGKQFVKLDIYASRTGSNIKIGLHDSGGTTTELTPNVASANTWQTVIFDLSAVSDANKDAIDKIVITIVNADAANTFYIDNYFIQTNIWGDVTNQISPVNDVFGE